jgi:hypothetical protein
MVMVSIRKLNFINNQCLNSRDKQGESTGQLELNIKLLSNFIMYQHNCIRFGSEIQQEVGLQDPEFCILSLSLQIEKSIVNLLVISSFVISHCHPINQEKQLKADGPLVQCCS